MKENSKAAKAGWRVIGCSLLFVLIAIGSGIVALGLKSAFAIAVIVLIGAWLLLSAFTLWFFRDPSASVPTAPDAVVSPAHGLVDCVEESTELGFVGGKCHRVSIFLSVLDVHVQNAPVAGRISFLKHQSGRFLSALNTASAECNKNMLISIESSERSGERIAVRQIAGVLARRIVSWVNVSDHVARGQRLGLIQYGSRCDLYLPFSVKVVVRPGDRVVGGETVVATRTPSLI
jgi:phosphatidylserine decarboxylase